MLRTFVKEIKVSAAARKEPGFVSDCRILHHFGGTETRENCN